MDDKTAYINPPNGTVEFHLIRDPEPEALLVVDLGMPGGVTTIRLTLPIDREEANALLAKASESLLSAMTLQLLGAGFDDSTAAQVYSSALAGLNHLRDDQELWKGGPGQDTSMRTVRVAFKLPQDFANAAYHKVVLAKQIHRDKPITTLRLVEMADNKRPDKEDTERIIEMQLWQYGKSAPRRQYLLMRRRGDLVPEQKVLTA